jgi:hypothetical protein
MDKAEQRVSIIEAHLTAISRGAKPNFDQIAVWLRELDRVPLDHLDDRIRQARDEHADKLEQGKGWGHITPDDVLRVDRRVRKAERAAGGDEPPENLECRHRCGLGRVSAICPEGYAYTYRCSCFAGKWWAKTKVFGANPDIETVLARPGWNYRVKPKGDIPEAHLPWINKRAAEVGVARAAREYRAHLKSKESR